jgi:hypothetical protein
MEEFSARTGRGLISAEQGAVLIWDVGSPFRAGGGVTQWFPVALQRHWGLLLDLGGDGSQLGIGLCPAGTEREELKGLLVLPGCAPQRGCLSVSRWGGHLALLYCGRASSEPARQCASPAHHHIIQGCFQLLQKSLLVLVRCQGRRIQKWLHAPANLR